jgi:hypothetical protein
MSWRRWGRWEAERISIDLWGRGPLSPSGLTALLMKKRGSFYFADPRIIQFQLVVRTIQGKSIPSAQATFLAGIHKHTALDLSLIDMRDDSANQ